MSKTKLKDREQERAAQEHARRYAAIQQETNQRAIMALQTSVEMVRAYAANPPVNTGAGTDHLAHDVYRKSLAIINSMLPEVQEEIPPGEQVPTGTVVAPANAGLGEQCGHEGCDLPTVPGTDLCPAHQPIRTT